MTDDASRKAWIATLAAADGESHELRSPHVGWWRGRCGSGAAVVPGLELGELDVLGTLYRVVAPDNAAGSVIRATSEGGVCVPVSFGETLVAFRPGAEFAHAPQADATETSASSDTASGAFAFRSTMSGRFYSRPSPDKAAYAHEGQVISTGDTVGLLEVMKTFTRLVYGGAGLPTKAQISRIVPADGDDLDAGDVVLEVARAK